MARIECRRGRTIPPDATSERALAGAAWVRTAEVRAFTKDELRDLRARRARPDVEDVLCVRALPEDGLSSVSLRPVASGALELRLDLEPVDAGELTRRRWFDLHVVCTYGPDPAPGSAWPDLHVIDVSDGAGCAPALEVWSAGQPPETVRLLPAAPAAWTAAWEGPARLGATATLVLVAPGLPAGQPVLFTVTQEGHGIVGRVERAAEAGGCRAPWSEWFHPRSIARRVALRAHEDFPPVRFGFTAEAAGRRVAAPSIVYEDVLDARLVFAGDGVPLASTRCVLRSPWGTREVRTDAQGRARVERLPPGGVRVAVGDDLLVLSGDGGGA